jgi:hypothetical protein
MWSTYPEHAHGASVQGERGVLAEACKPLPPPPPHQELRRFIADHTFDTLHAPTPEPRPTAGAPPRKPDHVDLHGMNGNRVQATEARLRCLAPFWHSNVSKHPEAFKQDAAELIRRAHE